jgi:hypothetical protein
MYGTFQLEGIMAARTKKGPASKRRKKATRKKEDPKVAEKKALRKAEEEALSLRLKGVPFAEIAEKQGLQSAMGARNRVRRALERKGKGLKDLPALRAKNGKVRTESES